MCDDDTCSFSKAKRGSCTSRRAARCVFVSSNDRWRDAMFTRANDMERVLNGSTDGVCVCVCLAQDRLTSVIIPVAGVIFGTALFAKGMVDLTTGTNKKEGF